MTSINYKLALEKSKKLINNWKKRMLSPLGQITVIKTFILSQFIHLLTILPSPSRDFLKNNKFNVLWFYLE